MPRYFEQKLNYFHCATWFLRLVFAVAVSPVAHSEESQVDKPRHKDDKHALIRMLDRQHEYISNQYLDLSDGLDRWISRRDKFEKAKNDSYFILNFNSTFEEAGERDFRVQFKSKIDLPNSEDRFKLIFESDPEEDSSPQANEGNGKVGDDNVAGENAILGLAYAIKRREYDWMPSLDVGSRLNLPPDAFVRAKFNKKMKLSENWNGKFVLDLPWFARQGAKPSLRQTFTYGFSSRAKFRSVTNLKYTRRESLREAYQSFQINYKLTEHLATEYKIGAYGSNENNSQNNIETNAYFFQIALRQEVYRQWIFIRIVPEIVYPREFDWRPQYAISLSLQAIYAK